MSLSVTSAISADSSFDFVQVDNKNFLRVKEALSKKLQNANLSVDEYATYLRLRCLKQIWDVDDVLIHLERLQPQDVQVRICFTLAGHV